MEKCGVWTFTVVKGNARQIGGDCKHTRFRSQDDPCQAKLDWSKCVSCSPTKAHLTP